MATVNDVASRAGVSVATVSRVLSGNAMVAGATRQRVLAAIRELEFSPNRTARALRLGRVSAVALLVGDIEQSVYASLTRHLQAALAEIGLDLLIYDLGHSNERLTNMVERAVALRLTGLALASTDLVPPRVLIPLADRARQSGLWVLSLRQQLHEHGIPSIVQDDRDAAARAVGYLLHSGRRSIAYVGRIGGSVMGTERFQGYRDALEAGGIALRPELVWETSYRYQAGYEALASALDRGVRLDAVQAASDEMALGAMAAIHDHGRTVPDDIAVIGFGNVEWSAHVRPALTTVSEHQDAVAAAMQAMLRSLQAGAAEQPLVSIERALVRRSSA